VTYTKLFEGLCDATLQRVAEQLWADIREAVISEHNGADGPDDDQITSVYHQMSVQDELDDVLARRQGLIPQRSM